MASSRAECQSFTPALFWTCLSLIFLVLFNFSVTNMASVYILGDLGGSNDMASYTISLFGIGNVLAIPLAIPMRNRFGIRFSLNLSVILFTITSFLVAFSINIPIFLIFRFLQGFFSGPIFILLTAFISEIATEEQKGVYFRDVLMSFIIAPTLAASLGGFFAYEMDWRWIFYLDAFVLMVVAMFLGKQLVMDGKPKCRKPMDFIGYTLFCSAVFPLSMFCIFGQQLDWFRSPLCFSMFVLGASALPLFIYWVQGHPNPILKLKLFTNFRFSLAVIYLAALFSLYFGMVILISLWLNLYVNYTVIWVSVGIGSMAVSAILMVFVIRGTKHQKSLFYLLCSMLFLLISSMYTSTFNEHVDFERIALSRFVAGFGVALFLPPLFHIMISACKKEETLEAVTLFQFARALSSSLGAALYTTLWQRRFYFYYDRLGSSLTEFSQQTKVFYQKALTQGLSALQANEQLNNALNRQARSLALNDCFYLMGWILCALLLFLVARSCLRACRYCKEKKLWQTLKQKL